MGYVERMLGRDEYIIIEARRHKVFMLLKVLPLILLMILGFVLAYLSWRYIPTVGGWLGVALAVLSFVPLVVGIYKYLEWRMERYMITNYRILQVEGIMNRRTFDSALEMVNDVMTSQSLFGRLFNFGSVSIITGSDSGLNQLWGIADPYDFKKALMEAKIAFGSENGPRIDRMEFVKPPATAQNDQPAAPQEQSTNQFSTATEETSVGEPSSVMVALTELRNAGVISQEEFEEKLGRLTGQPTSGQPGA